MHANEKKGSVVKESEPLVLKYRQWREITDGRFKACSETIYSHSGSGKDGEAPPEILGGGECSHFHSPHRVGS